MNKPILNNRNYQQELDRVISGADEWAHRRRLLLHCCCAPCSSYVLEYLHPWFDITIFFYNPNIMREEEYSRRKTELLRYLAEIPYGGEIHVRDADYDPAHFRERVRGHEGDPERGGRCQICFHMRLERTARQAAADGYDFFCTTLSVSPHKRADCLMAVGEGLAAQYGVPYLPSDFKKRDGYKRSIELSAIHGLYRQDYCGCSFSKIREKTADARHTHGMEE